MKKFCILVLFVLLLTPVAFAAEQSFFGRIRSFFGGSDDVSTPEDPCCNVIICQNDYHQLINCLGNYDECTSRYTFCIPVSCEVPMLDPVDCPEDNCQDEDCCCNTDMGVYEILGEDTCSQCVEDRYCSRGLDLETPELGRPEIAGDCCCNTDMGVYETMDRGECSQCVLDSYCSPTPVTEVRAELPTVENPENCCCHYDPDDFDMTDAEWRPTIISDSGYYCESEAGVLGECMASTTDQSECRRLGGEFNPVATVRSDIDILPDECCCQTDPDSPEDSRIGEVLEEGGCQTEDSFTGSCVGDSYCSSSSITLTTNTVEAATCSETDGGKDFENFGRTTGVYKEPNPEHSNPYRFGTGQRTREDYCVGDENRIVEFYCISPKDFTYMNIPCPDGTICREGECKSIALATETVAVVPKACTETDNGRDQENYGETTGIFKEPNPDYPEPYRYGMDPITRKDYCVDSERLVEFECTTNGEFTYFNAPCPDGTQCLSGECRSITVTSKTTTSKTTPTAKTTSTISQSQLVIKK